MNFFETSAKTNQNVNEVFYFLTQEILKNNDGKAQTGVFKLSKEDSSKGGNYYKYYLNYYFP